MIEEIVHLGNSGLFGLLTRSGCEPVQGPVMVLLNPGVIPRSGPFRLHVRMAHQMARRGGATFRFDLPGIGDAMPDTPMTRLQVVVMALDAIEQHTGVRVFVIGGLCLGADLAWTATLHDRRIIGIFQIDGLARIDYWFHLAWAREHFRWSSTRFLAAATRHTFKRFRPAEMFERNWPEPGKERAQLRKLLDRGVRMFVLYTGGITDYFRDPRQFVSTYSKAANDQKVRFAFWPECDHIFFAESDRIRVIDAVTDWYAAEFDKPRHDNLSLPGESGQPRET